MSATRRAHDSRPLSVPGVERDLALHGATREYLSEIFKQTVTAAHLEAQRISGVVFYLSLTFCWRPTVRFQRAYAISVMSR